MSKVVKKYLNIVDPFISATYYRTLGINSIHIPISDFIDFVNAPDNPFEGELEVLHDGNHYKILKWKEINLSRADIQEPIQFDAWIFGGGINCVGVREHFYDLHLVRSVVETKLGLEPGTISLESIF